MPFSVLCRGEWLGKQKTLDVWRDSLEESTTCRFGHSSPAHPAASISPYAHHMWIYFIEAQSLQTLKAFPHILSLSPHNNPEALAMLVLPSLSRDEETEAKRYEWLANVSGWVRAAAGCRSATCVTSLSVRGPWGREWGMHFSRQGFHLVTCYQRPRL